MLEFGFIDAHCHLIHEAYAYPLEYVQRAKEVGLTAALCTTGMKMEHQKVLDLCASRNDFLYPVIGVSPYDAVTLTSEELEFQLSFIEKNKSKIVGIGEIGLDFHHFTKNEEWKAQEKVFTSQIELAQSLDLPIVLHTRKAELRTYEILEEYKFPRAMLHCFLVPDIAKKASEKGIIISLPTLKSKNREKIAKNIPLANIVCETDSPYLWPTFPSEPSNVREVYEKIAEYRKTSLEKVKEQVFNNVVQLFDL